MDPLPTPPLITGALDRYKGLEITDLTSLAVSEAAFSDQLAFNLELWRSQGIRSVQIQFRPPLCHLMNAAAFHGFYFHHA